MTIKEFFEAAIEGGWDFKRSYVGTQSSVEISYEKMFLDPKAWEAVCKIKIKNMECMVCKDTKWIFSKEYPRLETCASCGFSTDLRTFVYPKAKMTEMVTALCAGKTLEEYIATL